MKYYTEQEYVYATHDREVREQIIEVGDKIKDLVNAINNLVDSYADLVDEGTSLGIPEEDVLEDWGGWIYEYEELKNIIEINNLNL